VTGELADGRKSMSKVEMTVNGRSVSADVEDRTLLSSFCAKI
jgi:aerobic-type carbon monoxide dehydrogenase small subunit (CoxS/CutS family)